MNLPQMAAVEPDAEHPQLPVWVGRTIWDNLFLLLVMDAVLFVGAIPTIVLSFTGGFLLAPLLAALTLGPLWAGTIAVTDRLIQDEAVSLRKFAKSVRCHARHGITVSVVPALVVTGALAALAVLQVRPNEKWLFIPLFVSGSVSTLVFLAGLSAFSLATTGNLRGQTLWRVSIMVVVTSPVITLGTLGIFVVMGFLVSWVPGLLPLFPALLAVHLSAYTWEAISRWKEREQHRDNLGRDRQAEGRNLEVN
jgi:uncharacterized membrane protein YesL